MIEAVRRLRNYRDSVGVPAAARIPARLVPASAVRAARWTRSGASRGSTSSMDGGDGEVVGSIGLDGATVEVLPERHRRPGGGAGADRRRARAAAGRDRPGARQARQPGLHRQGAAGARAGRAREARALRARAGRAGRVSTVGLPEASPALREAERYLRSLELFGMRFGLERMRRLMTALDSPQERFAAIHVLGTNGKSSTARMIAALLEQARPARPAPTCPRTSSRWPSGSRSVAARSPDERFAAAIARAAEAAALVDRTLEAGDRVTQFEALTAAAYWELARAGSRGRGGRGGARRPLRRHQRDRAPTCRC